MINTDLKKPDSFDTFLSTFKSTLHEVFYVKNDINEFSQKRGFPALVLRDIMATNPLSVAIPTEYKGRGSKVKECLGVLEAASYHSLPLSLTLGINIALFLEPVAKYAQDTVKEGIFSRFLEKQHMGGLMITEPDYGSDALNMQTFNTKVGDSYHIQGTKHWQGLTGMADYWIMTARSKNDKGLLSRDLDFFICDEHKPNQKIVVEEYYNNLGLLAIPYGKNKINIEVPKEYKLIPETTGLKLMMDLLHRSRYQFAGMGMGFIKRTLDEAITACKKRYVGGKPLFELDQVKFQIAQIQNAFTVCSAMCRRSAEHSGIDNNLALDIIEANSIKAYLTDLMQYSAQTLTQLSGANGYKLENYGARGIIDSRPFQIFEGSNEMLYTQIGETVLKLMRRAKVSNLNEYLSSYNLTEKAVEHFNKLINFNINTTLSQRKIIDLGKIISRLVSAGQVIDLGNKGFRPDLIRDSLQMLQYEVANLVNSYECHTDVMPIAEYHDESSWLQFA